MKRKFAYVSSASGISLNLACIPRIIVDSGCTAHMLPAKEMFIKIRNASGYVQLGNSDVISVIGEGITTLAVLGTVLYVPNLNFGLISIALFDKQGYKTVFNDGKAVVFDKDKNVILTATMSDGLYYFDDIYIWKC